MEQLFGIHNVLVNIFECLPFADQLRFAQVHSILSGIFANFIVPVKYRKLKFRNIKIKKKLLASNDDDDSCMLLTDEQVENFLQFGADRVEKLKVESDCGYLNFFYVVSWANLHNLTFLHYVGVTLSEDDLLAIAANCPKLSELQLIKCNNEDTDRYPKVGNCISLTTLEEMKNLKVLVVHGGLIIGMNFIYELITKVPLECLKLTASLVLDVHDNLISKRLQHHLTELEIDFDTESLKFFKRTRVFKNLLKFNVHMDDVTDFDLQGIARACKNLKVLSFGEYQNFKNIAHFVVPPNLKELSLGFSEGVQSKHVMDILTKFKIERFSCSFNGDPRLFKNVKISPYIEMLHLRGINTIDFPSFYTNNNTLKELHWYEYATHISAENQNHDGLKTCKNLENLIVHSGFIPLDVVLELSHLNKIQILRPYEQLNWAYIIGLLKHPCLKEFCIDYYSTPRDEVTNIPSKGFPSTITVVQISINFLGNALDFWLDMLQQNPSMLLKCRINVSWNYVLSVIKKLIHHNNFPADLRQFKVRGFSLNYKDLRENFLASIAPLIQIKDRFLCNRTLVLSRK